MSGIAVALGGMARAGRVVSSANILVLGAGAAGTALANRLMQRLDGASITLLDPRAEHWYQPGFTLVAAGLKPASYTVSQTADWLPEGVTLLPEAAAEIDPEARAVTTEKGTRLSYDFLIVATGLALDWEGIAGFSLGMVGENGIGAHYAGPDYAARTWAALDRFTSQGGQALIGRPATEMKCAGAPLKFAFLTEDISVRKGTRDAVSVTYTAPAPVLFSVPIVAEKVRMLFAERGIDAVYDHVLTGIDAQRKIAHYSTPAGEVDFGYDFINVIPPMRAPAAVRNSPLPAADKWPGQGWVEADPATLRHPRYPNIFALGDVAGVPKGKTAASVKWQVPVVEDHLIGEIAGYEAQARYDGYTSCPLITRIGRAMLVEFDYQNNLVPSFPGIVAPLEELWITWLMKEVALKATYNAMLRGRA
jgi:sulfide:quinone oxidoreductase